MKNSISNDRLRRGDRIVSKEKQSDLMVLTIPMNGEIDRLFSSFSDICPVFDIQWNLSISINWTMHISPLTLNWTHFNRPFILLIIRLSPRRDQIISIDWHVFAIDDFSRHEILWNRNLIEHQRVTSLHRRNQRHKFQRHFSQWTEKQLIERWRRESLFPFTEWTEEFRFHEEFSLWWKEKGIRTMSSPMRRKFSALTIVCSLFSNTSVNE